MTQPTVTFILDLSGDWHSVLDAVYSALGPDVDEKHAGLLQSLRDSWSADDDSEELGDGSARLPIDSTALLARLLPALEAAVDRGHFGYAVVASINAGPVKASGSLRSPGWYGERSGWDMVEIDKAAVAAELHAAATVAQSALNRVLGSGL